MALTPEGTPYVESSDLVANYPAASLSLANRVDLVGVLPFASAAARTTAIPSPTDGQYSYLQDTNTTQFWNGAAWQTAGLTPGLHLITPTSIANSGGTATASGGQVTYTGVTTVSLNGVFTSTYENYLIILSGVTSNNNTGINMRLRVAGTDSSASYNNQRLRTVGSTVTATQNDAASTMFVAESNNTLRHSVSFNIFAANIAAFTGYNSVYSAPGGVVGLFGGTHVLSNSYDGFTVIPSEGTTTGIVRVYGRQNS